MVHALVFPLPLLRVCCCSLQVGNTMVVMHHSTIVCVFCGLRDKRVDTTLKTISKSWVTAVVVVFQFVIHFSHIHKGFICVSFIGQSMVSGVFGRKEKRGKEWFLCFGFDCAFSTTLTLKTPFLSFFSAHTVIGVFWPSTCHTIFFHSSLCHSCVLLFATLILWPLLMTSSASSSMQQATLCKQTLK